MPDQAALFYMPHPLTGEPVRGEWPDFGITARAAVRIGLGMHPLENVATGLRLHEDACSDVEDRTTGPRCKGCVFAVAVRWHGKPFRKCSFGRPPGRSLDDAPRATHSETTDLRLWWPACTDYQPTDPSTTRPGGTT